MHSCLSLTGVSIFDVLAIVSRGLIPHAQPVHRRAAFGKRVRQTRVFLYVVPDQCVFPSPLVAHVCTPSTYYTPPCKRDASSMRGSIVLAIKGFYSCLSSPRLFPYVSPPRAARNTPNTHGEIYVENTRFYHSLPYACLYHSISHCCLHTPQAHTEQRRVEQA